MEGRCTFFEAWKYPARWSARLLRLSCVISADPSHHTDRGVWSIFWRSFTTQFHLAGNLGARAPRAKPVLDGLLLIQ